MLCENCQQSTLNDGSPVFQVETDDSGYVNVVTNEDQEISTDYYLRDRFPELSSLSKSANSGCEFCSFLRESILSDDVANCLQTRYGLNRVRPNEEVELQIRYLWNNSINYTNIRKHFLQVIVGFVNTNVQFGILCNIKAASKDDPVAKWLCLDSSPTRASISAKTIQWIKTRISECKNHNHELPNSNFLPQLLLDVRGKSPKLIDQDALISGRRTRGQLKIQTPRYAALSYCWGTADDAEAQLRTTRSSFSKRQAGIKTGEITPVLQDAIFITKQLSIPYLWIDSLCIFQDDIEDWNQQCTDMDKIYGHAEITIVAAASTSCREGFAHRKAPQIQLPFRSNLNQRLQGSMRIELRSVSSNVRHINPDIFVDSSESRLATRGWAVQERVLSTRQIIFGKLNVHFICPHWSQSSDGPLTADGYRLTIHSARAERNVPKLYSHWASILALFNDINANSFTCAPDLLPSISGMAADFAKRLKDDYLAGHWGNDLAMGLMWNRDLGFRVSKSVHLDGISSPIQYLVPSWSRLSQSGSSLTLRENSSIPSYKPAVEYISAHTTKKGNNAFGAISDGKLQVRGYSMSLPATDVIQFRSIEPLMRNWAEQICIWRITFKHSHGEDLCCDVRLDYDLLNAEIHEEVELWKWILLGTCKSPYFAVRTEGKEDDTYPFGLLVHRIRDSE